MRNSLNTFVGSALFTSGFVLGHYLMKPKPQIITKTEIHQVSEQKSQVQTQATVQKQSTAVKQESKVNITYSPNGKIKSKTYTETKYVARRGSDEQVHKIDKSQIQTVTDTKIQTTQNPLPNWMAGASVPFSDFKSIQPTDIKIHLGYRVVGSLYVFGGTNYNFSSNEIGVMVGF